MKRYKYNINGQWVNGFSTGYLMPISYTEVVPGDTVYGNYEIQMRTGSVQTLLMNPTYSDVYAYYVPYRLLWNGFPDFISKQSGTLPLVSDMAPEFFENTFTATPVSNEFTQLVPWQRRAYNLIYNQFFKRDNQTTVNEDNTDPQTVSLTPNLFHFSETEVDITNTTIDTSGAALDIDDVRQAFATDSFNKTREYYGDKYVDYLNAMGVKSNWSILEEPQVLAKVAGQAKYQLVDATAEGTNVEVGQTAGYYYHKAKVNIPRTFCPEHGLIVVCHAFKSSHHQAYAASPILANTEHKHYWSPEYDQIKHREYPGSLWWYPTLADDTTFDFPNFQHLRMGTNLNAFGQAQNAAGAAQVGVAGFTYWAAQADPFWYKNAGQLGQFINEDIGYRPGQNGSGTTADYSVVCDHHLTKLSPVGTRTGAALR